ncbi:hypothetical protein [Desulfovibrio desulfuricans]|uniref:hypothetical protein n=1 Tax=Desulfovibrio desulfuricans TaxID=876 RepID=UPI001AE4C224|nr:hypothetical protein [Desulfovibrio desulfuricans]QTO41075.1 hypothetical protein J8J02_03980 [Desulfovibrio desulfuricans]
MPNISHVLRRRLALAVWVAALLLFLLLGVWNVNEDRQEAENRLGSEAGRTAAQLAALLSLPAWELDELTARTIVMAAMTDESIYAIKVQTPRGMLEGQRRNYQWEPIPWDDEIAENSVQGMNPLKMEGRPVGSVEVYLSPRITDEDLAQKARREVARFCLSALFSTLVLLALLWHWGDLARLKALLLERTAPRGTAASGTEPAADSTPAVSMEPGLADIFESGSARSHALSPQPAAEAQGGSAVPLSEDIAAGAVVSAELGRAFLLRRPEAWRVTAGMFGRTFAPAPDLLLRLYALEDADNLCRLGRILEKAAPCVGAERLASTAHAMQWAVNDSDAASAAQAVEECVLALREVLSALEGQTARKESNPSVQEGGR